MTDPVRKIQEILRPASAKVALGLCLVIVLASIPMIIATAKRSRPPANSIASTKPASTRARRIAAMPAPATAPGAALRPGESARVLVLVMSLRSADLLTGRVLQPVSPTTVTRIRQTITLQLKPGTRTAMGADDDVKPGALLQAVGAVDARGTLHADSLVVLTGYLHVQ